MTKSYFSASGCPLANKNKGRSGYDGSSSSSSKYSTSAVAAAAAAATLQSNFGSRLASSGLTSYGQTDLMSMDENVSTSGKASNLVERQLSKLKPDLGTVDGSTDLNTDDKVTSFLEKAGTGMAQWSNARGSKGI